jgi:hypothetical protein
LSIDGPTINHVFFSVIEIPCLLFMAWTRWRGAEPVAANA